jgi:hypothetical protein
MKLDTGCEAHNLITTQVILDLGIIDRISLQNQTICTCLSGEELSSIGTISLRWKGKGFRKIFTTEFNVVEGGALPWEVILGAKTINEHSILKFAGFGGSSYVLPKKSKGMPSCVNLIV